MVAYGCGPVDYYLTAYAGVSDTKEGWVSEHILELQTIPRFLSSLLDGYLPAVPSMNMNVVYVGGIRQDIIMAFTNTFTSWKSTNPNGLTAGDKCLWYCGSVDQTAGMVVAVSNLNAFKGRIYRFNRPVSDAEWLDCCSDATDQAAQAAFAHLQTTMAVFDYYNDPDVKARHQWAYAQVKLVIAEFELAFQREYDEDISGVLTLHWKLYMQAHLGRVTEFAAQWVGGRIIAMRTVWLNEFWAAAWAGQASRMQYAYRVLLLLRQYLDGINSGQKLRFDSSIFT